MKVDQNRPLEGYDYWDSYAQCPVDEWQCEVANGDTRYGYWRWVRETIGHGDEE